MGCGWAADGLWMGAKFAGLGFGWAELLKAGLDCECLNRLSMPERTADGLRIGYK